MDTTASTDYRQAILTARDTLRAALDAQGITGTAQSLILVRHVDICQALVAYHQARRDAYVNDPMAKARGL